MGGSLGARDVRSRLGRFFYRCCRGAPFLKESDDVRPSEWLLRKTRVDDYKATLPVPFLETAYGANSSDTDGISLFRESFVSARAVSGHCKKAPYIVARIRASELLDLKLTLDSRAYRDPLLPGHVSVPELRYDKKRGKTEKDRIRGIRMTLAEKSIAGEVPEQPGSTPDATCGI